jgi:hypothetical protein
MSRLWLNSDFGPVEAINESIIIYHVVLSGDTSKDALAAGFEIVDVKK